MLHRLVPALLLFIALGLTGPVPTAAAEPHSPDEEAKCPVCGMFVAKYPDWIAQVHWPDHIAYFDGAKDMFKYLFDLERYAAGRKRDQITAIYVTEYYDIVPIEAREAWFVIGSDVYGPMGRELIPLATKEDARAFLKDHKGKRILRFDDVTPAVIKPLQ
jgi:nitrous oxide reductase accessory protein NosL